MRSITYGCLLVIISVLNACQSGSSSGPSNPPGNGPPGNGQVSVPDGLLVVPADRRCIVYWDETTEDVYYKVYWGTDSGTETSRLVSLPVLTIPGLDNGVSYNIAVTGITAGAESARSATISCTPHNIVITQLASGDFHNLALDDSGRVWLWGNIDTNTQLRTIDQAGAYPYPVCAVGQEFPCKSFLENVIAIGAGGKGSAAVLNDGSVAEWFSGRVSVRTDITDVQSIHVGDGFKVAVKNDNTVWAWGKNDSGQLGNNSTTYSDTAVQVCNDSACTAFLENVIDIDAGFSQTVVVKNDATVWTWGATLTAPMPVCLDAACNTPLTNAAKVSMGISHALALHSNGSVYAWGLNEYGKMGLADTQLVTNQAMAVPGISGATDVEAGRNHSLVMAATHIWAFGNGNMGQVGDGAFDLVNAPTMLSLPNISALGAGISNSLALNSDGTLFSWGMNTVGELGDGHELVSFVPGLTNMPVAAKMDFGLSHVIALRPDGSVWQWGFFQDTPQTYGTQFNGSPLQVAGLQNVQDVAAGSGHNLAIDESGSVYSWGRNEFKQLGHSQANLIGSPARVCAASETIPCANYFTQAKQVAAGYLHSVALTQDGAVWGWGSNVYAQLGGSLTGSEVPVQVAGLPLINSVAAGERHSLALDANGAVWSWGINTTGELGRGTTTDTCNNAAGACSFTPAKVTGLSGVTKIIAQGSSNFALKQDGTLWAWGRNIFGELGIGRSTSMEDQPVQVCAVAETYPCTVFLQDVVDIAAGLAVLADGTVVTWGPGHISDKQSVRVSPQQELGVSGAVRGYANFMTNFVVDDIDRVWSWGENMTGQMGDGSALVRTLPEEISGL